MAQKRAAGTKKYVKPQRPIRSGASHTSSPFRRVTKRQIRRVVDRVVETFEPERVILFGSYAYGKPNPDSDVDILIVMQSDDRPLLRTTRVLGALHGVKDFPMDILVRTPQEIAERLAMEDFFLREILERGQVLYERQPN